MKLVKVWWDHDDERYSQEAILIEEDNPRDMIRGNLHPDPQKNKELFFQQVASEGKVLFVEPDGSDLFSLDANVIVKIEVLEE